MVLVVQYFIDSGHVRVSINGTEVSAVQEGHFFGEIAFLATIRSLLVDYTAGDSESAQLLHRLGLADSAISPFNVHRTAAVTAGDSCRCLELNVKGFLLAFQDDLPGLANALRYIYTYIYIMYIYITATILRMCMQNQGYCN